MWILLRSNRLALLFGPLISPRLSPLLSPRLSPRLSPLLCPLLSPLLCPRFSPRFSSRLGLLLASTLLVTAGGCAVGPDDRLATVTPPSSFVNAASSAAADVDLAWWRKLGDPLLTGLIERAWRSNTDVEAALARLREARAERNATAGGYYPSVSANSSASRSRSSANGQIPFDRIPGAALVNTTYTATFDASWEIDLFGRIRSGVEAAQARSEGSEASARDALLSVTGDVAREYVEVRLGQQRLAVQRDNQDVAVETLRLATLRRDAGDATDTDVQRASTDLSSIAATRPQVESDLRAAQYRLELLLGEQPGALDSLLQAQAGTPAGLPLIVGDLPPGLPSDMLRRRPDVAAAERTLAAATADIGSAVAEQYPRFSLIGQLGQQATSRNSFSAAASRIWSIGPQVSVPIFNGGQLASQVQAREAGRDVALAQYRGAVLNALSDTETALVRDGHERERLGDLSRATASAERALGQLRMRYRIGDVALTDVLDAQRTRNAALDAQLSSQARVAENRVALYKALGGGWSTLDPLAIR